MKSARGFSILEVLIAMFVLLFGILAVIGTFPSLLNMNQKSWKTIQAVTAAEQKMEQIMQGIYGTPLPTNCSSFVDYPISTTAPRTWCGASAPPDQGGSSQSNIQWVWVMVTWTENGRLRVVKLDNYMSY